MSITVLHQTKTQLPIKYNNYYHKLTAASEFTQFLKNVVQLPYRHINSLSGSIWNTLFSTNWCLCSGSVSCRKSKHFELFYFLIVVNLQNRSTHYNTWSSTHYAQIKSSKSRLCCKTSGFNSDFTSAKTPTVQLWKTWHTLLNFYAFIRSPARNFQFQRKQSFYAFEHKSIMRTMFQILYRAGGRTNANYVIFNFSIISIREKVVWSCFLSGNIFPGKSYSPL